MVCRVVPTLFSLLSSLNHWSSCPILCSSQRFVVRSVECICLLCLRTLRGLRFLSLCIAAHVLIVVVLSLRVTLFFVFHTCDSIAVRVPCSALSLRINICSKLLYFLTYTRS